MGELHLARQPVRQDLDHGDQVEPQEREVVQVVVRERLPLEMGMDEPQAAEAPDAAAQASDVRQLEALGVSDHDVADRSVAGDEDADLAAELARDFGQMAGELGRDYLGRVDPAPEGALECADFGSLYASNVAVDGLGDGDSS
jgi:hypothetical protein